MVSLWDMNNIIGSLDKQTVICIGLFFGPAILFLWAALPFYDGVRAFIPLD